MHEAVKRVQRTRVLVVPTAVGALSACLALHRLLTDGCASPLYNCEVHPSELRATLYYVRSRLGARTDERAGWLASGSRAARY